MAHLLTPSDTSSPFPLDLTGPVSEPFDPETFDAIGSSLPPARQLANMPREVEMEVRRVAIKQIERYVIPLLKLHKARMARAALCQKATPEYRLSFALRGSPLLKDWPDENIEHLAEQGIPYTTRGREIVVHEGESCACGMWVLLRGEVQVVKRGGTSKKVTPGGRNTIVATLRAPEVLGDFTQLTEQPRTASIIALEECDWVSIPQVAFMSELEKLPEAVQNKVYETAFSKRRAIMWTTFPMDPADLRRSFLFADFSDQQLTAIAGRLQPKCYRRGSFLCKIGCSGQEMFFLRRGEVDVMVPYGACRDDDRSSSPGGDEPPSSPRGGGLRKKRSRNHLYYQAVAKSKLPLTWAPERTPLGPLRTVATLSPGACFGELSLIFGERRSASIQANTHCDVWVLLYSDLEMCFTDADLRNKVRGAANAQRSEWLDFQERENMAAAEQVMHDVAKNSLEGECVLRKVEALAAGEDVLLRYMMRCPVLKDRCTPLCLLSIRHALTPHVYSPRDSITSSSEICDRLLVLVRGRAAVQNYSAVTRQHLHVGDFVGYTCLAEHRWLAPIVAWETCDVWEIHRTLLGEILKRHSCYKPVLTLIRRLLRGARSTVDIKQATPVLFPTVTINDPHRPSRLLSFVATEGSGKRESDSSNPGSRASSPTCSPSPKLVPVHRRSLRVLVPTESTSQVTAPSSFFEDSGNLTHAQRERRAYLRESFSGSPGGQRRSTRTWSIHTPEHSPQRASRTPSFTTPSPMAGSPGGALRRMMQHMEIDRSVDDPEVSAISDDDIEDDLVGDPLDLTLPPPSRTAKHDDRRCTASSINRGTDVQRSYTTPSGGQWALPAKPSSAFPVKKEAKGESDTLKSRRRKATQLQTIEGAELQVAAHRAFSKLKANGVTAFLA